MVFLSLGIASWDTVLIKNALATFLAYFYGIITAEFISKEINKISFLIWERILLFFKQRAASRSEHREQRTEQHTQRNERDIADH